MTANTHADTVTTMPIVTEVVERVQMGVEKVIEEVTVNSVSVLTSFTNRMTL